MAILGIDDPWIWGGYIACFASVAFCIFYGWWKRNEED